MYLNPLVCNPQGCRQRLGEPITANGAVHAAVLRQVPWTWQREPADSPTQPLMESLRDTLLQMKRTGPLKLANLDAHWKGWVN